MTSTYIPDAYQILLVDNSLIKVFATWYGGYLDGDAWRVSSGTTSIEEDEDYHYFHGYSGSCYLLRKGNENNSLTAYGNMKYNQIFETLLEGNVPVKEISIQEAINILKETK